MTYPFSDRVSAVMRRLVPAACVLCGAKAGIAGVCDACLHALPRPPDVDCPICADAVSVEGVCGRCLADPPHYDLVVAGLEYAHPVDNLVVTLKYARNLSAARPLAFCLAQALDAEPYPDIVCSMPISRNHLAARGFNQAAEIARLLCAEFGLEHMPAIARRIRSGMPQASLPWRGRGKNVRGAFVCDTDLAGKSVAVVDDVLTTGATLSELARVLKSRGARKVTGWVTARTLKNR